jgi:hypothetical protein
LRISSGDIEAKGNVQNRVEPESTEPQTVDSVDSEIDYEIRSTSPLKEAVKEIGNVITCLYRLSITIQSPASCDRLERIERLGKANTKRRQLLKYHNEHHEKIVGRRVAVGNELDTGSSEGEGDFSSKAPTDMRTTVSTVYSANLNLVEATPVDLDSRSEAGFSVTSYASSAANSGSLRVPAPPPGFDKGPFQCPYCFIIVETESRASWK